MVQAMALAEGHNVWMVRLRTHRVTLTDHHPQLLHGLQPKQVHRRQRIPLLGKAAAQANAAMQPVAGRHLHVARRDLAPPGGIKRHQPLQGLHGLVQQVLRGHLLGLLRQPEQAAAQRAQRARGSWFLGRWRRPTVGTPTLLNPYYPPNPCAFTTILIASQAYSTSA